MVIKKQTYADLETLQKLEEEYETLKTSLSKEELEKINKFLLGFELKLLGYSNRTAAKLSGISPNSLAEAFGLYLLEGSLKAILRKKGRTPKVWEKEAYKLKRVNPQLYRSLLKDLLVYTVDERRGRVKFAPLRQIHLKYRGALEKEGFPMNKDTFKRLVEGIYLLEFGGFENMLKRILPMRVYEKVKSGEWRVSWFAVSSKT